MTVSACPSMEPARPATSLCSLQFAKDEAAEAASAAQAVATGSGQG